MSFQRTAEVIDKEKLYNWTIKELLLIIPMEDAKIEIDGRSSKQNMRKMATYLRHETNSNYARKIKIKFEDSIDDNLIQLADLIAGSIGRAMTNKTDAQTYIKIIKQKIIKLERLTRR